MPFGTTMLEATHQKMIANECAVSDDCFILHGEQPPSLLLECCGERGATLKLCCGGPCVEPL